MTRALKSRFWLRLGLISTVVLAIGVVIGAYFLMRHSKPMYDGKDSLTGLSHPVKITRDAYGIPHIFAKTKLDALRAQGYTMASERLFQMEIHRRLFRGELAEVFGIAALNSDKLYRSLMIPRSVEEMISTQRANKTFDEQVWQELQAYFDGVNDYVKSHPAPYEFTLTGIKPATFKPEDAYGMVGFMAYSFGIAPRGDVLMSRLSETLSPDLMQDLRNVPLERNKQVAKIYKDLIPLGENSFATLFDGSNGWLISPERSASGKSLLANDPHIGYSAPGIWYELHLKTEDGYEFYGHHIPLIPFAIIGHNSHHGWGFTMSLNDDMDLYQEKIHHDSFTYEFKGKTLALEVWDEVIKVKNQADYKFKMKRTLHGPLLNETLEHKDLALAWAFHSPQNDTLKALSSMAKAPDMESFAQALHYATAPGLNVMYADAKNIAWWTFGEVAEKANPHSDFILDGASGEDEVIRKLSLLEKPHRINPPEGVIVTANSRSPEMPLKIRGDWQSDDRLRTIEKLLAEKKIWSAEDLKSIQTKNFNIQSEVLLKLLMADLKLNDMEKESFSDALSELKNWDFHSDTKSTGAAIFHQWNNEILDLLLQDMTEDDKEMYIGLPYAWIFYERVIQDKKSPWWKKYPRQDLITEAFINTISKLTEIIGSNALKWRWGKVHTLEFVHPLGRNAPLDILFNVGPFPIAGAFNEINNNKARYLGKDFKVIAGPSTRIILDFGNIQTSYGILPLGNSGHKLSPFFKDQRKMFFNGEYRSQLMNEADIHAQKTHELILN